MTFKSEIKMEDHSQEDIKRFLATSASNAGFDTGAFLQLVEDTSTDVTLRILARFSQTVRESAQAIKEGLLIDDHDKVWRVCHKVAGTAELLGFSALGKLSRKLNNEVQAIPNLAEHLDELRLLERECEQTLALVEAGFPRLKAYL